MAKKTGYLLFCGKCGMPLKIPRYAIKVFFAPKVDGVYCTNNGCNEKNIIPAYLKKIREEL